MDANNNKKIRNKTKGNTKELHAAEVYSTVPLQIFSHLCPD